MLRHNRSLFILLLLGYQTSGLAAVQHHVRHLPATPHHYRTKTTGRKSKQSHVHAMSPRIKVINTLMAQLGRPYHWGGASPETGFDCSGLVWYTWQKNFNVRLPRTAEGMYNMPQASPVKYQHLQPGDMVFFSMAGERIDHVGVYVGNGHFIEAPHTGENVKIASLQKNNYRRHYMGARRLLTSKDIDT